MFKRRGFGLVFISLLMALAAAFVARNWIQARVTASNAPQSSGVGVVVAAIEIPFGTKVEARHVRTITLPKDTPVGTHFEKVQDAVGLIATQKVIPGEILLKERFVDHASGSTLAAVVRPNMRAVTVRVDDVVGVGGFLLPGNHVDVVAARMVNQQRAETETVLRNLNVLAVDQTASQDKDQPVVVRAVTLEVTPKQAEVLVRAREEGRIQLTLRNPTEDSEMELVADEPKAAPVRRAFVRHVKAADPVHAPAITVIRGTNVKTNESST